MEEKQKGISEPYRDKEGRLIRKVNGREIYQIEENTQKDIDKNLAINTWRMRK